MLAAEFPNDNPDLHEGTIWVCLDVTGAPVAERHRRPAPVVEIHPVIATLAEPILPSTLEPLTAATMEPIVEAVAEPLAEPVVDAEPPPARESGIFMTFSALKSEEELDEDGEILVEELGPLEDAILEAAVEPVVMTEPEPIAEPVVEPIAEPVTASEPATVASVVAEILPPASDDAYVTFVSTLVDIAIAHGATAAAAELAPSLDGDAVAQAWAGILRGTSEDWDAVGGSMLDEWAADTLARVTGADAQMLKRELRARGIAAFGLAA